MGAELFIYIFNCHLWFFKIVILDFLDHHMIFGNMINNFWLMKGSISFEAFTSRAFDGIIIVCISVIIWIHKHRICLIVLLSGSVIHTTACNSLSFSRSECSWSILSVEQRISSIDVLFGFHWCCVFVITWWLRSSFVVLNSIELIHCMCFVPDMLDEPLTLRTTGIRTHGCRIPITWAGTKDLLLPVHVIAGVLAEYLIFCLLLNLLSNSSILCSFNESRNDSSNTLRWHYIVFSFGTWSRLSTPFTLAECSCSANSWLFSLILM